MSLRDLSPNDFDATVYMSAYHDTINVSLDRFTFGRLSMWIPLETARQLRDQLAESIIAIELRRASATSTSETT